MKLSRLVILALTLMFAVLSVPLASAAEGGKLATYTHPDGIWSVEYPANLLHVEQLNPDATLFISKDRHTFVAVDTYDATIEASDSMLIDRGQAMLRHVYGKRIKNTGELEFPGARWAVGFGFATGKGSVGEAVYHQNGRIEGNYRIYGMAYGYKAASERAMLPIVERVRESLRIWPAAPRAIDRARDSLRAYFGALASGRYADAVARYGGSYQTLIDWNPDVAPRNRATLFARGCQQNGLQCLRLKQVIGETTISATEFNFVVEFLSADGTTFSQGPCCGETEGPVITRFPFNVKKVGGAYLVQDLPVYIP
ncbi:MAG TPA: hypothetical protein VFX76_07150 [Roseiflexaceae bacterium]|nr:hypothetical protein [Roseiflexaceae bacterium]